MFTYDRLLVAIMIYIIIFLSIIFRHTFREHTTDSINKKCKQTPNKKITKAKSNKQYFKFI